MSAKSSKARLLLIEDDRDTREAAAEFIRDEGFAIGTVRTVTEAFEVIDKQSYSLIDGAPEVRPPGLRQGRVSAVQPRTFGTGPFSDARFEVGFLSPLESGVVADWVGTWNHAANPPARSEGSIVLKFENDQLSRIGVRLDVERWISAQAAAPSGPSPTSSRRG